MLALDFFLKVKKVLYNSFDALTVPPGEFIETIKILGSINWISSNLFWVLMGDIKLNPTKSLKELLFSIIGPLSSNINIRA